jgi:hypothetical protein
MTEPTNHPADPHAPGGPPNDELDQLLRKWHTVHAERAAAGRDKLMARLRAERAARPRRAPLGESVVAFLILLRSAVVNRYSPIAASLLIVVALTVLFLPSGSGPVYAQDQLIMVPDGGKLDALDPEGNVIGPCPLEHTKVDVQAAGFLTRVTLQQTYANPYQKKIEAVYTFPLSHRAAVDRMTMTVGDRVVVGEVKEREAARRIYEAAKAQNYVASLLEQERPNIFTQSVANIEPGAEVIVEISYVEVLQSKDGTYTFDFPMVVGPRYIPGAPTASPALVPAELETRHGVILLGPANLTVGAAGAVDKLGTLQGGKLGRLLAAARPVKYPGDKWWGAGDATGGAGQAQLWYRFEAEYCDGSREFGELYTDGTGHINNRWFYTDPETIKGMGSGFAQDTNQVPDASRITPEPVRPGTRAGHDISLSMTIETGGPGLLEIKSALHKIERRDEAKRADGRATRVTIDLASQNEIPNRDFALSWTQTAETIQEATFVHMREASDDFDGGFFTLILQPPDRVEEAEVPPRELVFVMDTSGSMRGYPIEKSKAVMTRAIDAMRPADTFNVITFAGHTAVLWEKPRPATKANREAAKAFVESRKGGGGTEMMKAVNAALVQAPPIAAPLGLTPAQLADLPADGRAVEVEIPLRQILQTLQADPNRRQYTIRVRGGVMFPMDYKGSLPQVADPANAVMHVRGSWLTRDGRRVLVADAVREAGDPGMAAAPMRICLFLTDGYIGNDMAIIDAVRQNARTTRVFSFGIGNSVNRYLIDGMARAGRGEAEFVLLESDADEAVARLTKRIETPVLTDIELAFSDELAVSELIPAPGEIPDLFDAKPLVIHGRYAGSGTGTITVRGRTGSGPYERALELDLPAEAPEHDVIATLWARAKVDHVQTPHLKAVQEGNPPQTMRNEIVHLGESFSIMTQYTSFVAVEKSRMTIDGKPVLVAVPIEMPEGVSWEGIFGGEADEEQLISLGQQFRFQNQNYLRAEAARTSSTGPAGGGMGGSGAVAGKRGRGAVAFRLQADAPPPRPRLKAPGPPAAATAPPVQQPDVTDGRSGGGGGVPARGAKVQEMQLSREKGIVSNEPADTAFYDMSVQAGSDVQLLSMIAADADTPAEGNVKAETEELKRALESADRIEALYEKDLAGRMDDLELRDNLGAPLLGDIPLVGELFAQPGRQVRSVGGKPLVAERVAMIIGALVADDQVDEARSLADGLVAARPDYATGVKMRDVLADESLDDDDRKTKIAELAAEARGQIITLVAKLQRAARLKRVLEPALLAMLEPGDRKEEGQKKDEAGILVTILVHDTTEATTEALRKAGLGIQDTAESLPIIVGRATVADLEKVAMVESVRRIERTRME